MATTRLNVVVSMPISVLVADGNSLMLLLMGSLLITGVQDEDPGDYSGASFFGLK